VSIGCPGSSGWARCRSVEVLPADPPAFFSENVLGLGVPSNVAQCGQDLSAWAVMLVAMTTERSDQHSERTDLIDTLAKHRSFLRQTVKGLTDEQAAVRTTTSELCLGGLIKHVSLVEQGWADFIEQGAPANGAAADEETTAVHAAGFRMSEGDTLADLLDRYDQAARRTDDLVTELPSLDDSHPLPEAPWFEPGARWSARRVILHILAETAQHAGHADIIRESLDGAKTMG
jgi:uncharacterized damage-inducible protein DinB